MSVCAAELNMHGLWVALFPPEENAVEITEASPSASVSSFTPPLLLNKLGRLLNLASFKLIFKMWSLY